MMKKCKKPISVLLSILMVLSVFGGTAFTASAAEKELTETFNLGEYCHYDEDWEEFLADAHTGLNVTVAPTGNYIYVQDNCWFTHEDQRHEAIRVTVNNGDVIRKIVIKEYFYDWDTWRVCVNGRTIPGTTTTIDEDYNWVTFETVNAAQALIESPNGGLVEQLIVYYGDPVPTTYTITDASVNGTVTASVNGTNVTEAEENADVTLTVAPAEGYQFVSISAGDVSLTTVTEGSQYSFTMPTKDVTVTAVFEEIPAPQLPDVIAGCTYYDSYYGVYANVPFAVNFSDIKDGAIIFDNYSDTCIMDTKDYSYKFYDQTGTELEAVLTESYDDADGYGFRVIMNVFSFSNPISGPLYIVATAPAPTYTITWKNYDDSDIGTSTVAEGETPTFSDTIGEIKEKPDNALYTYTFSGWTPDVVAATADATYTAQFTAVPKPHTHDGITFQPWTSTDSLPPNAGNYYLTSDVTLSSTWTVPGGTTNLCLNGHGIIRTGSGRVIDLSTSGRNLNIYDCDTVTEHRFTVNNPTENGAGVAVVNDALTENYQTFTGGYITGGNTNNGAGIHVSQATLKLYGGTVIGNSNTGDGGGIYVEKGGNLYIDGGTVSYNQARQGGGIYAPNIASYAKIHLNSGRIEKNYATYTGGVYGGASVPVYLEGSIVVTGNYSLNAAGVTAAWNQSSARIYVSGSPYVYDNFNANGQSNLSGAYYENTMQITGNLGADCKVGLNGANGLYNYYRSDYTHTGIDPNVLFPYDNNNYILVKDGNNAKRISLYTITFKNYDDEVLQTSKVISGETPKYNGATPTKPADAQNIYTFSGWKDDTTTYAPDALPAVTGDTEYTATFDAVAKNYFPFANLSLNGDIGVNFWIDTYGYDPEELRVNVSWYKYSNEYYFAGKNALPTREIGDKTYFIATANVAAKEMADTITVRLYKGDTELAAKTYSVRDYALTIINAKNPGAIGLALSEDKFAALKDLCKALLKYGSASEAQFDPQYPANIEAHTVDGIVISASDGVSYEGYNEAEIPAYTVPDYSGFAEGLEYYGSSIGTKTTTNYLIAFVGSNAPSVQYKGATIDPVDFGTGGVAYNINGIAAKDITNDIVLNVNGEDVHFNMLAYITKALSVGDETLQSSVRALYDYGVKAKAYFNMAS